MAEIHQTQNCGTFELHGVGEFNARDYLEFMRDLRNECEAISDGRGRDWMWPGMILFSDAKLGRRITDGDKLTSFIRNRRLGTVIGGRWVVNPNTNNKIKFWIWHVNAAAMDRIVR
jgi:hypothetical protein